MSAIPSTIREPFPPTSESIEHGTEHAKHIFSSKTKASLDRISYERSGHLDRVSAHHRSLTLVAPAKETDNKTKEDIVINGHDLSSAIVVAVAVYGAKVQLSEDPTVQASVSGSVAFLDEHLREGNIVYGINTGYGGSADTRSEDFMNMQRGLIQHHNSAVVLSSEKCQPSNGAGLYDLKAHHLPRSVVRGAMLARCNSLMRGHSAVRYSVIQSIVTLLNKDFIPIVPLRGSISASGDLTPLAYIAGAVEGNSDIFLDCRVDSDCRRIMNAAEALRLAGLTPQAMLPKEGLGLMNGTAVSTAVATITLHEAQGLAIAAQVLTGMCTEALEGSADNYHPFISQVRPHRGQREAAANIARFLNGSKLVVGTDARTAGLYQDRYGLRTSPQWIGPQLEDLMLAEEQVSVELNSTTDNPLIDTENGHVHHGGNFQAVSVTSAMEKTRAALQMLGKLMFAQCSELINPMLNTVLTANLAFDDPDISFTFKGVDINMAAYMSELAFLANPVSSHVQSAEMHNQAVNSLALISSRYTLDAVEVVSLMTAAYLYAVCQALDLHALHKEYMNLIQQRAQAEFLAKLGHTPFAASSSDTTIIMKEIIDIIRAGVVSSKSKTTSQRATSAASGVLITLIQRLPLESSPTTASSDNSGDILTSIREFVAELATIIESSIRHTRARFAVGPPPTPQYLGRGSALVYQYIRNTLGVKLHRGVVEHPTFETCERGEIEIEGAGEKATIGSRITVIYEALRSTRMAEVLIASLG